METLLSRQLKQALLETEVRKQNGDLSSPLTTSSVVNPTPQQHTPSSSWSSWDPGVEESFVSVPMMQLQSLDEESFRDPSLQFSDKILMDKASAPMMQSQSLHEEAFHEPALQLLMDEPLEPTTQLQSLDEESFHDPSLQFINKMLMDEDLDERKCMMAECMAYFTTLTGFYESLGSNEVPSLPCLKESEALKISGQAVKEEQHTHSGNSSSDASQHDSSSTPPGYEDDGHLGVFANEGGDSWVSAQDDEKVWVSAQNDGEIRADGSANVKQPLKLYTKEYAGVHEAEDEVKAKGEEQQWIDDLFVNLDDIAFEQHTPADVVQSSQAFSSVTFGHSDSSGSSNFSWQHSFDSSSHPDMHEQDPLFKLDSTSPSSVWGGSSSLGFSRSNTKILRRADGNGKPNPILGANETSRRWSRGTDKVFTRSASDTTNTLTSSKTSLVNNNGRFKRASSEIDASVAFDSIRITSNSGSNDVDLEVIEEERVSFVRNKDLNAEKYASILNDGIGAIKPSLFSKSSPASTRENVSKSTIVVTTVADLKSLLISCAQAVASSNIRRANEILQEIRQDATPYGSGLQRLTHYFAEGLVARLSGTGERLYSVFTNNSPSAAKMLKAHHLFVEVSPFVKISHYFANRAIVEATKGAARVHIIDYGILYGIQWPSLISALAERKGGPPLLRITGIDAPQPGMMQAERVEMTGHRLAEYAKTYGVAFEYRAIANRWDAIQPSSLNLKQNEVVIVNSMNRMHHLLDETVVSSNPRQTVLNKIREINPKIFVQGIKNGNYNAPFFMSRFKEALASFAGFFDMMETVIKSDSQERMMIEREILGKGILNVVACEGPERIERPETYRQWQNRTVRAGLDPIPLDRNVLKESQTVVKCRYNKNFTVDEDGSWMLLSWKGKVVHGLSLWKPNSRRGHGTR